MFKKILGQQGEDIAVKYLKKRKYKILEKNYKCKIGEIDIITKKKDILCFVEVKTRSNKNFGLAKEAVNFTKQEKIRKIAAFYMKNNNIKDIQIRFDVVAIDYSDAKPNIEIIKNAF